jgi:hypothetical protein
VKSPLIILVSFATFSLGAYLGDSQHVDRFSFFIGPDEQMVTACSTGGPNGYAFTSAIFTDIATRKKLGDAFACVDDIAIRKSDLPKFGIVP